MTEEWVVRLPISPAIADVAGAPASAIEHYVRSVGRRADEQDFVFRSPTGGREAAATIVERYPGLVAHRQEIADLIRSGGSVSPEGEILPSEHKADARTPADSGASLYVEVDQPGDENDN